MTSLSSEAPLQQLPTAHFSTYKRDHAADASGQGCPFEKDGKASKLKTRSDSATLVDTPGNLPYKPTQLEMVVESVLIAPALALVAFLYTVLMLPFALPCFALVKRHTRKLFAPSLLVWKRAAAHRLDEPVPCLGGLVSFGLLSPLSAMLLAVVAFLAALEIAYSAMLSDDPASSLLKYIARGWWAWAMLFLPTEEEDAVLPSKLEAMGHVDV